MFADMDLYVTGDYTGSMVRKMVHENGVDDVEFFFFFTKNNQRK